MLKWFDPMVRLVTAAIVIATILPATGGLHEVVQDVSNIAVFVLFLLYGLKIARAEVWAGIRNWRLLLPLTLFVFGVMALAGWGMWQLSLPLLPPALALGFLYLGVLPSTVQSATAYSSIAGGNVASSVIAAALLNIIGVFVSAPLFSALAGTSGEGFTSSTLVRVMTLLLLPFVIGQAAQGFAGHWIKGHRKATTFLERGTIGLAVYTAFSGAVAEGIWHRVHLSDWGLLIAGCAVLLVVGYGGAWLLGRLLRLGHADRISVVFAGAQKSIAMGAPLATVLFPPASAGIILMPLLVYHLAQMVVAAPIARRLREG